MANRLTNWFYSAVNGNLKLTRNQCDPKSPLIAEATHKLAGFLSEHREDHLIIAESYVTKGYLIVIDGEVCDPRFLNVAFKYGDPISVNYKGKTVKTGYQYHRLRKEVSGEIEELFGQAIGGISKRFSRDVIPYILTTDGTMGDKRMQEIQTKWNDYKGNDNIPILTGGFRLQSTDSPELKDNLSTNLEGIRDLYLSALNLLNQSDVIQVSNEILKALGEDGRVNFRPTQESLGQVLHHIPNLLENESTKQLIENYLKQIL